MVHQKYPYQFDVRALITDLGGATKVHEFLKSQDAGIAVKSVQKMRERDYMQSDVIATLMVATQKVGFPIDPYAYIKERKGSE